MATEYAHRLGTSVVVLHKLRESGTETGVTHVVGDVRGRACVIVDDMISTWAPLPKVRQRSEPLAHGLRSPLRPRTGCCSQVRATS
jgi:orotate phosphoribosyltransferase-like protein